MLKKLSTHSVLFLFVALYFFSCGENSNEKPIAKVYDNYLYQRDILDIVPEGISGEDSVAIVKNYIRQWTQEMVLIEKAKKNVDKQFDKQLENYKNSLIIYEYERQIIDKLLDTNVTDAEIEKYYQENKDNFLLKDNILKVLYVKLSKNSQAVNNVKKLLFKPTLDEKSRLELDKIVATSSVNFYMEDQKWLLFSDLLKEIPIETYNQELFLQNNRNLTIVDSSFIYLARITDFKIRETLSPISFVKENIKAIIINKRKVSIIEKMHEELLKEAELKKEIDVKP